MDSAFEYCSVSDGWIHTFGASGGPLERIGATISAAVTHPATWWKMTIENAAGEIVHHWEFRRTGLTDSTLTWDGRQSDGHAAPNGIYTAVLTPISEFRKHGMPCAVSFIVENPLEQPPE